MQKAKCRSIILAVISSGAVISLMAAAGCGAKDDPPPNTPGYYTGDMKSKSLKPMSDPSTGAPSPGGVK
jgi:hypothetical protein